MKPKTLPEVIADVKAYEADCSDAYAHSKELRFSTTGNILFPDQSAANVMIASKPNDFAWSQLIQKYDAPPASWLMNDTRCPPELRAKTFNNLARDYRPDEELLVRMKGNNTRGVLSRHYTKYDSLDLLNAISSAIETAGTPCTVYRPVVGDFFSAYFLLEAIQFDRGNNHDIHGGLFPGAYASVGEVGNAAVHIAGGLYRSVCSNGAIFGWERDQDNTFKVIHRNHMVNTMYAIVAAGISSALKMSKNAAEAYLAAADLHVEPVSLKGIVSQWASEYGLSTSFKEDWLKAITGEQLDNGRENDARVVDIFNAATSTAREIKNDQERETVERLAGAYLWQATEAARPARPVYNYNNHDWRNRR